MDNWPPTTWPDGMIPTTAQLRTWLRTFTAEHDARPAAGMILGMLEDSQRALATERERAGFYASQALRFRAAWRSARRRGPTGSATACRAVTGRGNAVCGRDADHRGSHRATWSLFSDTWEG